MAVHGAGLTNWQTEIDRRSPSDRQRVSAMAVSSAAARETCGAWENGLSSGETSARGVEVVSESVRYLLSG